MWPEVIVGWFESEKLLFFFCQVKLIRHRFGDESTWPDREKKKFSVQVFSPIFTEKSHAKKQSELSVLFIIC